MKRTDVLSSHMFSENLDPDNIVSLIYSQRMTMKQILPLMLIAILCSCSQRKEPVKGHENNPYYSRTDTNHIKVSNAEWKTILNADLYAVAREANTEKPFTGKYWNANTIGAYYCAVCGNKLFLSDAKFSSTCGWPSFFETVRKNSVLYRLDTSFNDRRTEVLCARCDSHLGHIFNDGPPPSHKRFCMNSISLEFEPNQ